MNDTDKPEFRSWAATARPRLRRTAFLLCGDWHLAEDLTQDTLVRLYAVWNRISRSGTPDAYATRTLVNSYRALLRRPWRRREAPVDYLPEHADPHGDAGAGQRDELLRALAGLGRSQRAIVVLRYWDDRSVDEVAEMLGLSTGTVKSQSARGLARLRSLLGEATDPAAPSPYVAPPPNPELSAAPLAAPLPTKPLASLLNGELS